MKKRKDLPKKEREEKEINDKNELIDKKLKSPRKSKCSNTVVLEENNKENFRMGITKEKSI
jgi:hypothetical protein